MKLKHTGYQTKLDIIDIRYGLESAPQLKTVRQLIIMNWKIDNYELYCLQTANRNMYTSIYCGSFEFDIKSSNEIKTKKK